MSNLSIKIALETALDSITPAIDTVWENTEYKPVAGTIYQRVDIISAEPENPAIGSFHRENGMMQVTLFYPLQVGTGTALTRAELIRAKFLRGASFSYSGVTVTIEKTPEISAGRVDGDRWAIPVKIRFYSNIN